MVLQVYELIVKWLESSIHIMKMSNSKAVLMY